MGGNVGLALQDKRVHDIFLFTMFPVYNFQILFYGFTCFMWVKCLHLELQRNVGFPTPRPPCIHLNAVIMSNY